MSDRIRPVVFEWSGEHMVPAKRFMPLCNRQYVVGEEYVLEPASVRSLASHRHFFAVLNEGFKNLPDKSVKMFPTIEHYRKWCLVQVGYASENVTVLDTPKDARLFAAAARMLDEYVVIKVSGNVVTLWRAKSMSGQSMNRREFQEAKEQVLYLVADMINVKPTELSKEAERASGQPASPRTRFT